MSYCPKCGNKVDETMTFCPRCGASLKMEQAPPRPTPPPAYRRDEKSEKHEKNQQQQGEKGEKHEKGGSGHIGWLIGGMVVILIGILAFLQAAGMLNSAYNNAIFLLVIGIALVVIAVYFSTMAKKRNPAPSV
jgi:uncharacterized membrane protein YvbJ